MQQLKLLKERWLHIPKERMLFKFKSEDDLLKWRLGSDADFGGRSTGNWALTVDGTGVFWGTIVKSDDLNYAILKSNEPKWSIFHKSSIDASDFKNLLIRAKIPQGNLLKNWKMNIKTEAFYATHIYSHPLEFSKVGEFETLEFKFRHFKMSDSHQGRAQKLEMDRSKIKSLGFSVGHSDAVGDFSLEIDWIMLKNKDEQL